VLDCIVLAVRPSEKGRIHWCFRDSIDVYDAVVAPSSHAATKFAFMSAGVGPKSNDSGDTPITNTR